MKTYKLLYDKICSFNNLILAYKKARKGKTKKNYVLAFEDNLYLNLMQLQEELINQTYKPRELETFILRDPKIRKISKSDFRDRIIHHAVNNIIEPIFNQTFIYDSCANRIGKGNLFALKRLDKFKRKATENLTKEAFCLKADIKHYFQEVNQEILLDILIKKIKDEKVIWLIKQILDNYNSGEICKGMPLGNLTSQFFANVYLNELDYFIKHKLGAKYYIRYVDDFVVLYSSKEQLKIWKYEIEKFLWEELKLEIHPDKSKVISLSNVIDFVGFRNFYYFKLVRKRNIIKMLSKIKMYKSEKISKEELLDIFQGWNAYSKWANSFYLRKEVVKNIYA
ncbi:MAG TPA: reverse transcriptase domain-containing protein [Candidatus Nanoarchaeia archaeon]|nr:reverse transcriptase domain-containing protein [Candidatus Nanoarchaeia archaeon]